MVIPASMLYYPGFELQMDHTAIWAIIPISGLRYINWAMPGGEHWKIAMTISTGSM